MIKIIACINSEGNLAGFQPPKRDLQRFAALTIGGVVIMGRKTWELLPEKMRPLSHRQNIIVTRANDYAHHPDAVCYIGQNGLQKCLAEYTRAGYDLWVIGGGEVYAETIHMATYVYLSRTNDKGGSVPFPVQQLLSFKKLTTQNHDDHTFEIWRR